MEEEQASALLSLPPEVILLVLLQLTDRGKPDAVSVTTSRFVCRTLRALLRPLPSLPQMLRQLNEERCVALVEEDEYLCPDSLPPLTFASVAAEQGHLGVLQWGWNNGCTRNESTCAAAARGGHLDVLQWLHEEGCAWDALTCCFAAGKGHLRVLQWAMDQGCRISHGVPHRNLDPVAAAARGGHIETLAWIAKRLPLNAATFRHAARGGHWEVMEWLKQKGCPWNYTACTEAARLGRLDILEWLRQDGCEWKGTAIFASAANGHLEVLRWCIAHQCPRDQHQNPLGKACYLGLTAVVECLLESGFELTKKATNSAAEGGQLELLKHLIGLGCRVEDYTICSHAALGGHMHVLEWLHEERGYPLNHLTMAMAAQEGRLDIVKWLRARGCEWSKNIPALAAWRGHRELVLWLRNNGCPEDRAQVARALFC